MAEHRPTEVHNAAALLGKAVILLATEDGDLRQRLIKACIEAHLVFAVPCPEDRTPVPDDVAEALVEFFETVTQRPDPGDMGTLAASVHLMADEEVQEAARTLIYLADRVSVASALAAAR